MSKNSKLAPLTNPSILSMAATQFFSALGDTGFRNLVALIITMPGMAEEATVGPLAIAQICFMLPYVIFAPWVGTFADRFPKKYVLSLASGWRAIFLVAVFLFIIPHYQSYFLLYLCIAFTGTMAATYSPAKYGIIPELTPPKSLVIVNGVVESGTLAAILLGTIGIGALADWAGLWSIAKIADGTIKAKITSGGLSICVQAVVLVFALSAGLAFLIPKKPPYAAEQGVNSMNFSEYLLGLKEVFLYPPLRRAILCVALFWTIAAGLNVLFFPFGSKYLGLESGTAKTSLYFALVIGIIIGSGMSGFLPRADKLAYVRKSALGFSISIIIFAFMTNPIWGYVMLILTGVMSGIYLIPLNAAIQRHSKREITARVIATSNLINNITMILISGLLMLISIITNPAAGEIPSHYEKELKEIPSHYETKPKKNTLLSKKLTKELEKLALSPSENLSIRVLKKDSEWALLNSEKKMEFSLKWTKGKLKVFPSKHVLIWMIVLIGLSMALIGALPKWEEKDEEGDAPSVKAEEEAPQETEKPEKPEEN